MRSQYIESLLSSNLACTRNQPFCVAYIEGPWICRDSPPDLHFSRRARHIRWAPGTGFSTGSASLPRLRVFIGSWSQLSGFVLSIGNSQQFLCLRTVEPVFSRRVLIFLQRDWAAIATLQLATAPVRDLGSACFSLTCGPRSIDEAFPAVQLHIFLRYPFAVQTSAKDSRVHRVVGK